MRRQNKKVSVKSHSIDFEIDHIDPLGQGVSKKGGAVTFIAGTLPGETGTAMVYKRAKGVQFARLETLDQTSSVRVDPVCPHFDKCPGCQFLHTDYSSELAFKKTSLLRHLAKLGINEADVETVAAPRRLAYRNRVQLHYRHQYIGMLDTVANEVLEIPQCQIFRQELKPAFDQVYSGQWTEEHSGHGHCELYYKSDEVSVNWNKEYSHGGFSQVYEEMNLELKNRVQEQLIECTASSLLDLFSGSGNLSQAYAGKGGQRVLIDNYKQETNTDNFFQMDLYEDQTLPNFLRKNGVEGFDTILLDPPRRGFPGLSRWVKKIKPNHLIYVSCNPSSLAWDIQNLESKFRVKSIQLLDMFPATAHFETMVVLEMRKRSR
jgi:23S rRNA (uracil1939-C5)-methyltransferase